MRRWHLVFLIAVVAACGGVHQARFSKVTQAAKAISASISERPNLGSYRELLKGFSTELTEARSQASTSAERAIVTDLDAAQTLMKDLLLIWEERTKRESDLLPMSEPLVARIATQFELPVNTNEPPSIYANEAMQAIWSQAKEKLSAVSQTLGAP